MASMLPQVAYSKASALNEGRVTFARPGLTSPLAQSLVELVRERTGREPLAKLGWTDVARFSMLGIPAVNLGAGSPLLAHKHDEQLPESDLLLMANLLEDWLK